jgi:hypothetical protein
MDVQAMGVTTIPEQIAWTSKCMHYIIDNCLDIPVYANPAYNIEHPYVHSDRYVAGLTRWQTEDVWMENTKSPSTKAGWLTVKIPGILYFFSNEQLS